MRLDVQRWFRNRTYDGAAVAAADLVARKRGTISVVLPALNEESTVGAIVKSIRGELLERVPLVDEVVVIDPGSTDGTAAAAADAGARVVAEAETLPGYGKIPGKGEALWKSLYATRGDIVVWVDADLEEFDPALVTGLLSPLLLDQAVSFVKASYDRPLRDGRPGAGAPRGGGRVTEMVARPLLNAYWPALAGVMQPLAGECAGRRSLLERLPFASGYGVEMALLIDVLNEAGLDAIAQVDVGTKLHAHQDELALGRMAAQVLAAAGQRLGLQAHSGELVQFDRTRMDARPLVSDSRITQRPPMITIPEYLAERANAS